MAANNQEEGELEGSPERDQGPRETGPYILRNLIEDLPLSADGESQDIDINCVEYLDQNLYVGTSASEILHFFQIPPDPDDAAGKPSYILASRLPPFYHTPATPARPGVQQILLLPKINKACVLCNWTVTFYSLPELSPIFETVQIRSCNWIGGVDLNSGLNGSDQDANNPTVTVLLSLNKKMRVVRIGEDPRGIKGIDFAGCTVSIRRDSFACVADSRAYALLDVDRQLKIPLFPISSAAGAGAVGGRVEDISGHTRSSSLQSGSTESAHHGRSTSVGTFMSRRPMGGDRSNTPDPLTREPSPAPETNSSTSKPLPDVPPGTNAPLVVPSPASANPALYLKPHIVSPSPQEFLLVTGTGPHDPGLGIFVNLEGDITRSTLDFANYPEEVVVDGRGVGVDPTPANIDEAEEGFVLASMACAINEGVRYGIEIQRWDMDPGEGVKPKYWLETPPTQGGKEHDAARKIGMRSVVGSGNVFFDKVVDKLRLRRFCPFESTSASLATGVLDNLDAGTAASLEGISQERQTFGSGDPLPAGWEEQRDEEELQFTRSHGESSTRVVAWSGNSVWWIVRNPLAMSLDAVLSAAAISDESGNELYTPLDRRKVLEVISDLRSREARTETEFISLGYIKQKAGLLLFIDSLKRSTNFLDSEEEARTNEARCAQDALLDGGLDPRVILALVPSLRDEIIEGRTGIWIHGGVKAAADHFMASNLVTTSAPESSPSSHDHMLPLMRLYLTSWRRKKGFGSVSNESEVFQSVDAALLLVLLRLDKSSHVQSTTSASVRLELNDLVDHEVDCFERVVVLLESYHRLFLLSRLYQSKKMVPEVLATWRRILEGEKDDGGEFTDGEHRLREYLTKIRNPALVQEYGVWLAARNPKLGVQVFAEEKSLVKFDPKQVVDVLREGAPGAVKDFLEYLVFTKNHAEYINELIAYYLDIVTSKLEGSEEARATLAQTYQSYRALRPPKPTYRQFITENTVDEEWWHSRLRLLTLLGGSQGTTSQYDVAAILQRIAPFTQELVPEVIILDGRQSHHEEALKLLTHGLGDYDTALNYCLLGGSSIYNPISGTRAIPTHDEQAALFSVLLSEFLRIEDISNRVEQTSNLLERFGGWFDVGEVVGMIPDSWAVELVGAFLVSALRRIVRERSETAVVKALAAGENLRVAAEIVDRREERGGTLEREGVGEP